MQMKRGNTHHPVNENNIVGSPLVPISLVQNISKCIVLIQTENWTGTGFLCHLPIENTVSLFYGIMTNNHVLGDSELAEGNTIHISSDNYIFENGEREYEIEIVPSRYTFTSKALDATFISVSPSELGTNFKWLEVSKSDDNKKDQDVIIVQHPLGGPQNIALGKIYDIAGIDIKHLVSTNKGSSGSPMMDVKGNVIGLHKSALEGLYNNATKTSEIIKAIEKDINDNYDNKMPPEVVTVVNDAKNALSSFLWKRKMFEITQINVFYAKVNQIFGGSSKSRRVKMENQRDQEEKEVRQCEQVYRSLLNEIDNLVERCQVLNRTDLCKLLLTEKAGLLMRESTNRKERANDLDNEIRKASRSQFNGGTSSSDRAKIQDMQRVARNDAAKLEERVSNIRTQISCLN